MAFLYDTFCIDILHSNYNYHSTTKKQTAYIASTNRTDHHQFLQLRLDRLLGQPGLKQLSHIIRCLL